MEKGVRKIDETLKNLNDKSGLGEEDFKKLTRLIEDPSTGRFELRYDAFKTHL